MKTEFDYNLKRDTEVHKKTVWFTRLLGLTFVINGIVDFFLLDASENPVFINALKVLSAFGGIVMLFFPRQSSRKIILSNEFVKKEGNTLSWKLASANAGEIDVTKISQITKNTGEAHFKMQDGSVAVLDFHKIQNKAKADEFLMMLEKM